MLPTIASGSSTRGRKNRDAALRALAKVGSEIPVQTPPATAPAIDPSRFAVIPTKEAAKRKRKPGELKLPAELRDGAVLHLPRGETYTQAPRLPASAIPGRAAIEAFLTSKHNGGKVERVFVPGVDMLFGDFGEGVEEQLELYGPATQAASRHRRRRLKQHENWTRLVSVQLLEQYLLHKYSHGEHDARMQERPSCSCVRRVLTVTLADWDGK